MPKGNPGIARTTDPPELVTLVRQRYAANATQAEIAAELGRSLKFVQGVFRRNQIPPRKAAKRDQRGANNANWKGDAAGYQAMHLRLYATKGRPYPCSVCQTTTARAYDWANLTGKYQDIEDYVPMCRSCHWKHDGKVNNLRRKAVMPSP